MRYCKLQKNVWGGHKSEILNCKQNLFIFLKLCKYFFKKSIECLLEFIEKKECKKTLKTCFAYFPVCPLEKRLKAEKQAVERKKILTRLQSIECTFLGNPMGERGLNRPDFMQDWAF